MKRVLQRGGRQDRGQRGGNQRKLEMETAKTCRSKTALERQWKHCHSVTAASACLDLSETRPLAKYPNAKAPQHTPTMPCVLALVAGAVEQT